MTGIYLTYLKRREHKNVNTLRCAYPPPYDLMETFRFKFHFMFIGWTKGGFYIINFQVLWVFTLVLIIHWWNRIYLIISKALFWGYVGEGHVNLFFVCLHYLHILLQSNWSRNHGINCPGGRMNCLRDIAKAFFTEMLQCSDLIWMQFKYKQNSWY